MTIGARQFNKTITSAGVLLSPPDATMDALQLPRYTDSANPGRLYSETIWFENVGQEWLEIRTDEDLAPANAGEATVVCLRLGPGQRDKLVADTFNANLDTGYGTHMFYAFSDTATDTTLVVECK